MLHVTTPTGRALSWQQRAAQLAPPLPLGLVADLGMLLVADQPLPTGDDAYAHFLREVAQLPVVATARSLGLNDLAVAAILAHLAAGVPATDDLSPLLDHLATRLRTLSPADVRFLHAVASQTPGVAEVADLRGLRELLGVADFQHALFDEVLAFTPALADVDPGASMQTYTADGYGGLARTGSLDAIVPSEWALPSDLVAYRFLNGELLYYGHERPPERRPRLLLLLVQLGDAMAGDLEVLAKAGALALARSGLAHGMVVQVISFDAAVHPPQGLARPTEVAALVRRSGQGRPDLVRVVGHVAAHLRAQASTYSQIEVCWCVHSQLGLDEREDLLARISPDLRRQARSRVLFLSPGAPIRQPGVADLLADQWVSVGSAALYDAAEQARAIQALRDLAQPRRRVQRREAAPRPQRRVVVAAPRGDPVQPLLEQGAWEAAFDLLEPRARSGDAAARRWLAVLVEGERGADSFPPLGLRLRAAGLLGALGDPRLLDPQRGDAPLGGYWCHLPAGSFWFGDAQVGQLERQSLPYAFSIGRYLVTNSEYRRFLNAGGYQQREWWSANGWPFLQASESRFKSNGRQITHPWYWADPEYNQPNQPVVGISWWEAAAYCAWLTDQGRAAGWLGAHDLIRLPTALEWEYAARGDQARRYPWGDAAPSAAHANFDQTQIGRTTPVGCFPQGAAACGALDLAGNVMEWLATPEDAPSHPTPLSDVDPDAQVLLSHAAFDDDASALRCGAHSESGPFARYLDRGFRMVLIRE